MDSILTKTLFIRQTCVLDHQAHFANVKHVKPPLNFGASAALSN